MPLSAAVIATIVDAFKPTMPKSTQGIQYLLEQIAANHKSAAVTDAAAITASDTALAAVTGVDGTGNNAASKTDVDARLVTQEAFNDQVIADLGELRTQLNALLAALRTAGLLAS